MCIMSDDYSANLATPADIHKGLQLVWLILTILYPCFCFYIYLHFYEVDIYTNTCAFLSPVNKMNLRVLPSLNINLTLFNQKTFKVRVKFFLFFFPFPLRILEFHLFSALNQFSINFSFVLKNIFPFYFLGVLSHFSAIGTTFSCLFFN